VDRGLLREHGLPDDGEIVLQTFPRVFGYVFNPVSFWFCHDRSGALIAVLAEVNNTFGGATATCCTAAASRCAMARRCGRQAVPRLAFQ
jgi:DUF1365 family protein